MNWLQKAATLLILILSWGTEMVFAQVRSEYLQIGFSLGSSTYDPTYESNSSEMANFISKIMEIEADDSYNIHRVEFYASASPDGSDIINQEIIKGRMQSMRTMLQERLAFDTNIFFNSIIDQYFIKETWLSTLDIIENDPDLPSREKAVKIIKDGTDIPAKLKALDDGKTWSYLADNVFPSQRFFKVIIYLDTVELVITEEDKVIEDTIHIITMGPEISIDDIEIDEDILDIENETGDRPLIIKDELLEVPLMEAPVSDVWNPSLTFKTNGIAWLMLIPNIAAEFDFSEHFSLSIPFYYSGGYNYFSARCKFRGIVLQPEGRYHFNPDHISEGGLFLGAHFGIGWYNFSLGGKYRRQSHRGLRPAIGGGVSVGYAMQFDFFPRLGLEFTLGAGAYDAKYDMFYNVPNGAYYKTGVHKVFVGIDNASVSLTYKLIK